MAPRIVLTQAPQELDVSRWDEPLCVHPDGADAIPDCDSTPLSEVREQPRSALEDHDTAMFLGLTDMMTPSNRTDDIWEFAFNQMETPAVSVDTYLFRSDPWRAWFHFGLVGAQYRDYTYSYLAETDYDQYFNGKRDENPFSLAEIGEWGEGVIESHYEQYFRTFEVATDYETDASEEYEYSELVDELFAEKNTMGQVRRALDSYADEIYPDREIPSRHQLFRGSREWELSVTDLPIDQWRASYLRDLVELTNGIVEGFHVES